MPSLKRFLIINVQVGDGTNLVIMLAGALLKEAEDLLRMGLKPTEVAEGYELALEKALAILETLSCYEVTDISNKEEVKKVIKAAVMSKQYGNEEFLANLVCYLYMCYKTYNCLHPPHFTFSWQTFVTHR